MAVIFFKYHEKRRNYGEDSVKLHIAN